jgi:hypothetical protein
MAAIRFGRPFVLANRQTRTAAKQGRQLRKHSSPEKTGRPSGKPPALRETPRRKAGGGAVVSTKGHLPRPPHLGRFALQVFCFPGVLFSGCSVFRVFCFPGVLLFQVFCFCGCPASDRNFFCAAPGRPAYLPEGKAWKGKKASAQVQVWRRRIPRPFWPKVAEIGRCVTADLPPLLLSSLGVGFV